MSGVARGRYYPEMPPYLPDESPEHYSDRLCWVYGADQVPYDHRRNRQCSLGWHEECTDPAGEVCECPCHRTHHLVVLPYAAGTDDLVELEHPPSCPQQVAPEVLEDLFGGGPVQAYRCFPQEYLYESGEIETFAPAGAPAADPSDPAGSTILGPGRYPILVQSFKIHSHYYGTDEWDVSVEVGDNVSVEHGGDDVSADKMTHGGK